MKKTFEWSKKQHREMLKSSTALISASIVISILNLFYSTYLGRQLNLVDFGLLSLLGSIISLIQIPLSVYSRAVTHKSALLYGKYGTPIKQFWAVTRKKAIRNAIIFSFLWLCITPFLSGFFQTNDIMPFLLVTPIWIAGIFSAIDGGFLSGNHRFLAVGIISLVETTSKLLLTILFVETRQIELVYSAIPISMIMSLVVGWLFVLAVKENQKIVLTKRDIKTISKKFLGSTLLIKFSTVIFLSIDVILAKHYLSPTDAGKYALLSLVGKMVYFLGALFSQFINPLVSRNVGAGESSKRIFYLLVPATIAASFLGFCIFAIAGPVTLPLLLGHKILEVMPYVLPYELAFGAIATAVAIVSFHQSLQRHGFAFLSLFAGSIMVGSILIFHDTIQEISLAVTGSGIFYLALTIFFHFSIKSEKEINSIPSKILILNWRDTKHSWAGGAEVYVHEIAKSWVKEGKEVIIFCGNDKSNPRHETIEGVKIIRRGGHYTVYLWAVIYYLFSLGRWCDVIVESENGIPFFSQLYSNKPVFLLIHHVHQDVFREHLKFPFSKIAMFIERYLMPSIYRGGRVITVSESTKNDLVKLGLAEIEDIEIVNPGVKISKYKNTKETSYPSFIYIGRLKRYKNIDIAIMAFSKILKKYNNAQLTIVGKGEMLTELKDLVNKLNIRKSVIFTGHVDEYEKAALLSRSWIALQPSSFEGWGITVIEANALGTPVIASRVAGLKDSVVDLQTGLLVEVKDTEAWATAMMDLVEDNDKRSKLAKKAKKWSENFKWHSSAKLFLDSIEKRIIV